MQLEKGNSMEKLNSLVAQVKNAADKLKGEIAAIDSRISEAQKELSSLVDSKLTKSEFMEFVTEDIRRKGLVFAGRLKQLVGERRTNFMRTEGAMKQPGASLLFPYLTGSYVIGQQVTDEAIYWYFPEIIRDRFETAIADLEWPEGTMPVEAKRTAIRMIEGRIEALNAERDTLADELIGAGLAG